MERRRSDVRDAALLLRSVGGVDVHVVLEQPTKGVRNLAEKLARNGELVAASGLLFWLWLHAWGYGAPWSVGVLG